MGRRRLASFRLSAVRPGFPVRLEERESDRPEYCHQVGVCAIRDLPRGRPAGWPVQVSYTYETNGRLHVAARLKSHPASVTTDFMRENTLADEDLELWTRYVEEEARARA